MSTTFPVNFEIPFVPKQDDIWAEKNETLADTSTLSKSVTHSAVFYLQRVYVSANGDATAVIKTDTGGVETERRRFYLSKADANQVWVLDEPKEIPIGDKVVVQITNNNGSEIKASLTVQGFQVA